MMSDDDEPEFTMKEKVTLVAVGTVVVTLAVVVSSLYFFVAPFLRSSKNESKAAD